MQLSICGVNLRCKAPGQVTTATPSVTSPFSHLSQPMSPRFCLLVFLPNALLSLTDAPKPPAEDAYLRFDEYGGTGRPRRSAGKSQNGLNVETLVVADAKMVEKHGKDDVTTYILTVMNMVRGIVRSPLDIPKTKISWYGWNGSCLVIFFLLKNLHCEKNHF